MKTFKDLKFEEKSTLFNHGQQAKLTFDNGYGVSVIKGFGAYGNDTEPYELAVILNGELDYDHPTAQGDVRGYLTEEIVTTLMQEIEATVVSNA